jgi:hypothetical protein
MLHLRSAQRTTRFAAAGCGHASARKRRDDDGHAPIILPAVTGWRVRYAAAAYRPLALLHVSVLLRIVADLAAVVTLRGVSGVLTILALVAYAATLAIGSRQSNRRPTPI